MFTFQRESADLHQLLKCVWRRSVFKFCVYKLAEAVRYLKFKWEFVIIGRGCLVLLKFKFLCRRMLCFKALQRLCSSGIKLPCVNPTSLRADSQWIIILKTFELVTLSFNQFHAQRNWLLTHALHSKYNKHSSFLIVGWPLACHVTLSHWAMCHCSRVFQNSW